MNNSVFFINITCPVCASICNYPQQVVCGTCGWPVLVFSSKPGSELENRLRTQQQLRTVEYSISTQRKSELKQLETQYNHQAAKGQTLATENEQLLGKRQLLDEKIKQLKHRAQPAEKIEGLKQTHQHLKIQLEQLNSRVKHATAYGQAPIKLKCSYDKNNNSIIAEVIEVEESAPSEINMLIGLAVYETSSHNYAESVLVIPVKESDRKTMIYEKGEIYKKTLAARPLKDIREYEIIHLDLKSTTQFVIL